MGTNHNPYPLSCCKITNIQGSQVRGKKKKGKEILSMKTMHSGVCFFYCLPRTRSPILRSSWIYIAGLADDMYDSSENSTQTQPAGFPSPP